MFYLVKDDERELLPDHCYATLAEARRALSRIATRIPQSEIDRLLMSDDQDNKCLGRLLASEAWPAFELWLDSEATNTAEEATRVLDTIVSFAAMVLAGVAKEHWPVGEDEIDTAIERLVAQRLRKMMEVD
jgi:hypothetical protein